MIEDNQVSVIIPSYNSAHFVTTAVDSVLAQTYQNFEILVIDDGSRDNTREVLERYGTRICYINQENAGVAAARNKGIEQSRGRYVSFLDADDTWYPEKLEKQVEALSKNPNCKFCYSAVMWVDDNLEELGIRHSHRKTSPLEDLLFYGNIIGSTCGVICERNLLNEIGGFDPNLSQCADWDMWIRLAMNTEFHYIEEPLITYRQHNLSMSNNARLLEKDSLIVMEKSFAYANLPEHLRNRKNTAVATTFMVLAGTYFQAHMIRDFLRCAVKSIAMDFPQVKYLLKFPLRRLSGR